MAIRQTDIETFSALLEAVYDAAIDPASWELFLRGLAHALNGKSGMFRVIDERGPAVRANVHYNLDPELQEAHRAYYVTRDVYVAALRDKPGNFIAPGESIMEHRQLRKTEFFTDYMKPQDSYHVCGGLAMRNEEFTIKFGLQRDRTAGPFSEDDAAFIRRFVPHIQRAARLDHLLDLTRHQQESAEQALESLAVGIMLLDERERVLHSNAKAREVLTAHAGLSLVNGHLTATRTQDMRSLSDLLAVIHSRSLLGGPPIPETILLTPNPGEPQLLVVACPVKSHHAHFHGPWPDISIAVFISNLADAGLLSHDVLMTLYGLTPAEARLACALAKGYELTDLTTEWHVSRETLRTHLKRVLGKTGTSRQAELVRLLNGKPWSLVAENAETAGRAVEVGEA